ncbi:MAG TPA: hypothetical protein VM260_24495, partial [Pirellula sp.]|nr:hypothetical protein [Pirellula sp.]
YSVFDVSNTLLVMRPYQIAATERIMWKINGSYTAKTWSKPESGGFARAIPMKMAHFLPMVTVAQH